MIKREVARILSAVTRIIPTGAEVGVGTFSPGGKIETRGGDKKNCSGKALLYGK